MVEFVCDDNKVEKALRKLCDQVTQYGGFVHDALTIGSYEGDFVITVPDGMEEGERILVLPRDILLPVHKYDIVTADKKMVLRSCDDDLGRGQVVLMETMLELYNLVGKVDQLQRTSTIDAFLKHPDFFEKVIAGRQQESMPFLSTIKDVPDDKYWIELYMKARVFGFDLGNAHSFARNDAVSKVVQPMLMPIIDFLNHHPGASPYNTSFDWIDNGTQKNGDDGIFVMKSCPVEGSRECYVHYGANDAMETFIHYNYVEASADYLRSIPLHIKISGLGTLNLRSKLDRPNTSKLPEKVQDLKFFIPEFMYDSKEKLLDISSLFIPQSRAPRALRRVLGFVLRQVGMPLEQTQRMKIILRIEKYIIQENMRFYTDLSTYLDSYKMPERNKLVLQNARDMVEIQLTKIRRYSFYEEAMQGIDEM